MGKAKIQRDAIVFRGLLGIAKCKLFELATKENRLLHMYRFHGSFVCHQSFLFAHSIITKINHQKSSLFRSIKTTRFSASKRRSLKGICGAACATDPNNRHKLTCRAFNNNNSTKKKKEIKMVVENAAPSSSYPQQQKKGNSGPTHRCGPLINTTQNFVHQTAGL